LTYYEEYGSSMRSKIEKEVEYEIRALKITNFKYKSRWLRLYVFSGVNPWTIIDIAFNIIDTRKTSSVLYRLWNVKNKVRLNIPLMIKIDINIYDYDYPVDITVSKKNDVCHEKSFKHKYPMQKVIFPSTTENIGDTKITCCQKVNTNNLLTIHVIKARKSIFTIITIFELSSKVIKNLCFIKIGILIRYGRNKEMIERWK